MAGTRPKTTAVTNASVAVKAKSRRSTFSSFQPATKRTTFAGIELRSASRLTHAMASATGTAASDTIVLSMSSSRTMRIRLAPIARRTAISRCRSAPRARSRLATLAPAINSTKTADACHSERIGPRPTSSMPCASV